MADSQDSLEGEIWKPVPGWDGIEVSSLGRVFFASRVVPGKCGSRRRLPARTTYGFPAKRGYRRVKLGSKNVEVHQLICAAFHGPRPSNAHGVAHANDVKDDNRACNLRWATQAENAADAIANGLFVRGERISTGKLTASEVLEIRARHDGKYGTGARLAREYGIRQENVIAIVKRRSWTHI